MVPVAHVGWGPDSLFVFVFYHFIKKYVFIVFIYWVALDISCGRWDLVP